MRHRSIKSRAGKVMLGAVLAGALSGAGASIARASLTLDLEAAGGTPNSPVTTVTGQSAGGIVDLTVYAVVTGGAGSAPNDGIGGLFASFDGAGSAGAGLSLSLQHPNFDFDLGSAASVGSSYGPYTDSSGTTHIGIGNYSGPSTGGPTTPAYDSTTPDGWAFAAYLNNTTSSISSILYGGTALTDGTGAFYNIGTLQLTLSGSAANGSSEVVNAYGRTQQTAGTMVAALWTENGVVTTPTAGTAITADDSITVDVGSVAPKYPGDISGPNGTPDGSVNSYDLNAILAHYGQSVPIGNTSDGDITGPSGTPDGVVNSYDLNVVLGEFGDTGGSPSIILAPEPGLVGALAIGALGVVSRRRRV